MSGRRLTRDDRQKIVEEFARRHNGRYNPALFLEEVRRKGVDHPAFHWFEWNQARAAKAHLLEQARSFARDLRIVFKVEELIGPHSVRIKSAAMPVAISPIDGRRSGGGYVLVDPDDPEHIGEHCLQAAKALEQWLKRYEAALLYVGLAKADVNKIVGRLESAAAKVKAA